MTTNQWIGLIGTLLTLGIEVCIFVYDAIRSWILRKPSISMGCWKEVKEWQANGFKLAEIPSKPLLLSLGVAGGGGFLALHLFSV